MPIKIAKRTWGISKYDLNVLQTLLDKQPNTASQARDQPESCTHPTGKNLQFFDTNHGQDEKAAGESTRTQEYA